MVVDCEEAVVLVRAIFLRAMKRQLLKRTSESEHGAHCQGRSTRWFSGLPTPEFFSVHTAEFLGLTGVIGDWLRKMQGWERCVQLPACRARARLTSSAPS